MLENVTIIGTGLIGASIGLALRANGFGGELAGWDASPAASAEALRVGALTRVLAEVPGTGAEGLLPGVVVLAGPVFSTLEWMERLAPVAGPEVLLTDVGSTKALIAARARALYRGAGRARFLPGHPMAGKEQGGAGLAEEVLFRGRRWLFTPVYDDVSERERAWMALVTGFGAELMCLEPERHDALCAWVSHLPQMVATALAALLEERFADHGDLPAIGGRALSEMTRLGASPYSMWRDVAMTNTQEIADALLAMEQALAHLRENLVGPELREMFAEANRFRRRRE